MPISSRSGVIFLFITILICVLVLFPILQYVVERDPQLSAYDEDWNDISNFRIALEDQSETSYNVSAILSNPAVLDEIKDPSSTLLIIAGTESPYSNLELEILVRYMENGGSILVFGDFDYSNTIAGLFAIEYVEHTLWDQNYRGNVSLIETTAYIRDSANGDKSYSLLLNEPVAIKDLQSAQVNFWSSGFEVRRQTIMSTSGSSWIDSDDDGAITPEDEAAPASGFALGMRFDMGPRTESLGSAVFISDSSLPINEMWNENQNSLFLKDLVKSMIGSDGVVLFDESRHTQDSFGASLFQAALGFYFLLSGDTLILQVIRLNVLVAVIILTMALSLRQPEPRRWYHIFDIMRPRPFRSYGHNLDNGILALQEVFLERIRLKYQIYEFDDKSRKERLTILPNLLRNYNIPLDDDFKMLLGAPTQIRPNDLRSIAKKLSTW
ncbi:MAG: hypothetical protein P8R34_04800 [archaeon]|nr:hypothetical protein [archaeon]|tara:strand:- start:253 stop:1569 length:1317 start_codon:yes stop_codon:yes gene_type:complete